MSGQVIRQAFLKSLPVMAGYIVLGIGFGILLRNAGYGAGWAFAMSGLIYAGSMQFVGVSLISGGASLLTTALTTFMVNARHLFYSISMIDRYKDAGKYKPYLIFALTDETYSLVSKELYCASRCMSLRFLQTIARFAALRRGETRHRLRRIWEHAF